MFAVIYGREDKRADLGLPLIFREQEIHVFAVPGAESKVQTILTRNWFVACRGQIYSTNLFDRPWVGDASQQASLEKLAADVTGDGATRVGTWNGQFVLLVYDRARRKAYIVSDRFGSKRMFWRQSEGIVWVFPKVKYFKTLGVPFTEDFDLFVQYLTLRYIANGNTFFSGVRALRAAAVLHLSDASLREVPYWQWNYAEPPTRRECSQRELADVFFRSIQRCVGNATTVTVPLSGGYDSRAILAGVLEHKRPRDIVTVTFGSPGTLDWEIGNYVAKRVGTHHVSFDMTSPVNFPGDLLRHCSDMDGAAEPFHQVWLTHWESIKDYSDKLFVGYLGGELAGSHVREPDLRESFDGEPDEAKYAELFRRHSVVSTELAAQILGRKQSDVAAEVLSIFTESSKENSHRHPANWFAWWDMTYRQTRFVIPAIFKLGELYEYASPFADADYVDFWLEVPVRQRFRRRLYRQMLTRQFPRLFEIPVKSFRGRPARRSSWYQIKYQLAKRLRGVANEVDYASRKNGWSLHPKPFMNTVDVAEWIRSEPAFAEHFAGLISGICERGVVDADYVRTLYQDHCQERRDASMALACIGGLELCYRCFDETPVSDAMC